MSSHSGGLGAASPAGTSGEGGSAEWRRIYERLEALGADRARLEALNGIQHEFWSARDNINQARIHQAELSRGRWEAACKELLPGDSPSLTELLASDSEDSRLCNALFEIENSELKIQLKEVGTCIELYSTDHEQIARGLRTDLRKLKEAYESMCANKDKEVSALLAENDFLRNQLREMEKNNTALLKIKEVEEAQATEVTHKLQKFVEEMQLAVQNKDNEIGRSRAEAVNANKRVLILDGKLMEMHSIVEEKNDEIQNLLKIKEVEAAQATKEAQKLQQNIEELEVAAQNKDDEIGRLRAEAVDAENKLRAMEKDNTVLLKIKEVEGVQATEATQKLRASPLAVEESNLQAAEDNSANTTELTDQGGPELKKAKKMGRPPKVCSDSYPHRCRPPLITRAVELMNPKQIKAVKNIPFGGFMGIQLTKPIPKNLLHYMARRVNTQTKMLELKNDRSVKISLADAIEKVTSLENKGEEVPLDKFLGGKHRSKRQRKASSSSMHPEEFIKRFSENRDVEDTCSNFAALVLSCVIAPNTSVNVNSKFLPYIRSRDRMRKFNWNKFGLMYMMTAIDQLNEGNYSYWCVNGLLLLSIFVDMVVVPDNLKIPSGDLPLHSYIKDEHISWLNKREGTWDRLEVKELSESVYAEEEDRDEPRTNSPGAGTSVPSSPEIDSQISETLRNMTCDELLYLVKSNPVLYNDLCEKTKVQERSKRKSHPPKVHMVVDDGPSNDWRRFVIK